MATPSPTLPPPPEKVRLPRPLRDVRLNVPPSRDGIASAFRMPGSELERAAYERGRTEGGQSLNAQLLAQSAELLELKNGVLAALRDVVPQVVRETEHALIDLALEVARRLVADLPLSAGMVEAAVREALAQAEETTGLTVQLHPEDLALLERSGSGLLASNDDADRIRFEGSAAVSRGGCLVRTRFGVIDARRETKLALIREAVAS